MPSLYPCAVWCRPAGDAVHRCQLRQNGHSLFTSRVCIVTNAQTRRSSHAATTSGCRTKQLSTSASRRMVHVPSVAPPLSIIICGGPVERGPVERANFRQPSGSGPAAHRQDSSPPSQSQTYSPQATHTRNGDCGAGTCQRRTQLQRLAERWHQRGALDCTLRLAVLWHRRVCGELVNQLLQRHHFFLVHQPIVLHAPEHCVQVPVADRVTVVPRNG